MLVCTLGSLDKFAEILDRNVWDCHQFVIGSDGKHRDLADKSFSFNYVGWLALRLSQFLTSNQSYFCPAMHTQSKFSICRFNLQWITKLITPLSFFIVIKLFLYCLSPVLWWQNAIMYFIIFNLTSDKNERLWKEKEPIMNKFMYL